MYAVCIQKQKKQKQPNTTTSTSASYFICTLHRFIVTVDEVYYKIRNRSMHYLVSNL